MTYSYTETMAWVQQVGLGVCGAPCGTRTTDPQTLACQRETGHDGPHDPR